MAAVQAMHHHTLADSQKGNGNKIYNVIHNGQSSCVIVGGKGAKRPLAPAPQKTASAAQQQQQQDVLRCKRKINFVQYGGPGHQPASVARRNARERNRVKQVNNGFATLRQHIPASVAAALASPGHSATSGRGASKKLSKVETLRMAVEYIRSLQRMIEEYETKTPYYSTTSVTHQQQTPPCSEASSSPTPSFTSESSVSHTSNGYAQATLYHAENYENYEPTSPEDEELLDAISWWQQQ